MAFRVKMQSEPHSGQKCYQCGKPITTAPWYYYPKRPRGKCRCATCFNEASIAGSLIASERRALAPSPFEWAMDKDD